MLYINGEWIEPGDYEKMKVYNPANGELIKEIATDGAKEARKRKVRNRGVFRKTICLN